MVRKALMILRFSLPAAHLSSLFRRILTINNLLLLLLLLDLRFQQVFDKDTFSSDDPMGDAELDIQPFFESVKMDLKGVPDSNNVLRKQASNRDNCLAEESSIRLLNGKIVQDIVLRLRNVECGEIELQLRWVDLPVAKTSQAK